MNRLMLLLPLALLACGEDTKETDDTDEEAGEPLTCELLAGDNCWKEGVAEAAACLPETTEGVFTADRTTCDFADGSRVVFVEALPEELDGWLFDFVLEDASGSECMGFRQTEDVNTLDTSSGTVEQRPWQFVGVALECQDGSLYTMDSAFGLMECDWDHLPGTAWSWSGGHMSFSLNGGPEDTGFSFSCEPPAG